ncbi:MAG: hypothetical protein OHK0015_42440 [Chloroflexi bacterium OHK40]
MGIDSQVARFLAEAHQRGCSFQETLTLGRQFLLADRRALQRLARQLGARLTPELTRARFAEPLFRELLGARRVESLDAAPYEGATIVHDLNTPLPHHLHCQFDAVVDGGTLEHIFNLPVALANAMHAVKVGGRLFCVSVANNFLGHGFYQLSPELFYRALTPVYGFRIERMVLVEFSGPSIERASAGHWYEVADPQQVGGRVTLVNRRPALLMVQAEKCADVGPLFKPFPQQSDYTAAWRPGAQPPSGPALGHALARLPLVGPLVVALYDAYRLRATHSLTNRRFYRPVGEDGGAMGQH